ncbi:MAG: hypothetical protein WA001_00310 [Patescibacteria group bacterium]
MVKTLKKVFSTFVTLTTILSSVGIGAMVLPSTAAAATLSTGALIKASGPAVYYYAADGKRYVFPNEKTYFSWFNDFSSVQTITDDELAAIPIGANVTIRPGTKLVKITTDPKTYAVSQCGTLHWIQSEAIASALYGSNWAQRVVDVPDGFFVNYTIGSSIASNIHPDGQVIQYSGDSNWYVVWNGQKRKFTSTDAFAANMENSANSIQTTITYGNGPDVTGRESDLADVVCTGSSSPVSGGLTVALASDTPAGMTVPKNASSVPLVKVNFTAGSSAVNITGLTFHRVGVGSVGDFSNVYLYDGNGTRLSTGRTVNSSSNTVQFNSLNITVPANSTWSALLYGDFSSPDQTGGQHAFEIPDAASVVATGNVTISGSFPVRGNVFTVGTVLSGRLDVQKGATPSNPTIGAKNTEISNFKLTANTNNIAVKQITLYQAGSVSNSDLSNFQLYDGSTVVASSIATTADGHIVLTFATPYVITNGQTKIFSLHANVGGRAGRTIRTYVEYTTDVSAVDQVYNAGASVCINDSGACTTSPADFDGATDNSGAVNGWIEVTTQGGTLTNAFNGPPTQNIAKGQTAVPLYNFALTSADNDLNIRNIRVDINTPTAGCDVKGSAGTDYFRSIRIIDTDTGVTVMGPTEIPGTVAASSSDTGIITFTDSWDLLTGQTRNLSLVADLSNSEDGSGQFFGNGDCVYTATMKAFQSNDIQVVSTGEFLDLSKVIPNSDVQGNPLTVKSSSLNVSLASSPGSGTIVRKQANVPVSAFALTSSAQSDVTITSLTLSAIASINGGAWLASSAAQRITSLALYNGTTQVGIAQAPDTVTGRAVISNMNLLIPKGTTVTLTAEATFASQVTATPPYDRVAVGIASTSDIQAQDQSSNDVSATLDSSVTNEALGTSASVVQTVVNGGTLTVQADASPASNIVIACPSAVLSSGTCPWVPFAQYKATAQNENVMIDRIAVVASSTAGVQSDDADFHAIAIASNGTVVGQDVLPSGATGTKDVLLNSPITVPNNGSVDFQIWAQLNTITSSSTANGATQGVARSGHAPALGLNSGLTTGEWNSSYVGMLNIHATGAASGNLIMAAAGAVPGNLQVLRKTQPVVTKQSLSNTTLANADDDLLKFQVSADSAGSIGLKQIIFTYSKSSTAGFTLSNFRLRSGASDLNLTDYSVTDDTGANLQTGTVATGTTSGKIIVSFTSEQSISGSGNVYTLHATAAGVHTGDSVQVAFYRDPTAPIVTGYLASNVADGGAGIVASTNIYAIDTGIAPSNTFSDTGSFLWSDDSEVPHNPVVGTSGGSRDWTNDVYVQDISQSQSLSN